MINEEEKCPDRLLIFLKEHPGPQQDALARGLVQTYCVHMAIDIHPLSHLFLLRKISLPTLYFIYLLPQLRLSIDIIHPCAGGILIMSLVRHYSH